MWTYQQATGRLLRDSELVGIGYSGHEEGRNAPDKQAVIGIGPIPRGTYEIGDPHDTSSHGPYVMRLTAADGNEMFGRDGFLIHGDSKLAPGTASHGCIILSRDVREQIGKSLPLNERTLEVVHG